MGPGSDVVKLVIAIVSSHSACKEEGAYILSKPPTSVKTGLSATLTINFIHAIITSQYTCVHTNLVLRSTLVMMAVCQDLHSFCSVGWTDADSPDEAQPKDHYR